MIMLWIWWIILFASRVDPRTNFAFHFVRKELAESRFDVDCDHGKMSENFGFSHRRICELICEVTYVSKWTWLFHSNRPDFHEESATKWIGWHFVKCISWVLFGRYPAPWLSIGKSSSSVERWIASVHLLKASSPASIEKLSVQSQYAHQQCIQFGLDRKLWFRLGHFKCQSRQINGLWRRFLRQLWLSPTIQAFSSNRA